MCVMSMVHDHFEDRIPHVYPAAPGSWYTQTVTTTPDLAKLIEDFKRAREAAAVVDEATGKPDCVDLDKQKLEARVAELEKLLVNPPEFVIVTGGNVEPGTYRVIDGKLYRAI